MKKVKWSQFFTPLSLYSLFVAIGALAAFFFIFRVRSEQENAWFMGYSLEKILLGFGLLLVVLICAGCIIRSMIAPEWAKDFWGSIFKHEPASNFTTGIALFIFFLGWLGNFLPAYRISQNASAYMDQLRPVFIWAAVVSMGTIFAVCFERRRELTNPLTVAGKAAIRMGFLILIVFLSIWVLIAVTGIGVRFREDYWYGAGVPVLGLQILFSLVMGALILWLESRITLPPKLKFDLFIFTLIWLIAAVLWSREPLRPTYFMPGNSPLGREIYPYSDSAIFDIASQFALIGQGIFNGQYFDRALYSSFLTYLHMFAGQNTGQLMIVQASIYAVFPAIIYLLGRELHSRALGFSLAVLIALRGVNSIAAAAWIDLASPKMMLTDFPTAIGIAAFIFFVLKWLKEPHKAHLAVWAGAMLGLTFMLRTHVILLLPVVVAYFFLTLRARTPYWWIGSIVLVIGMLTVTLPWDIRNQTKGTPPFYIYYSRIETILNQRYGISTDTYLPPPSDPGPRSIQTRSLAQASSYLRNSPQQTEPACTTRACSFANHLFHNLTTSVLVFPTSFTLDGLRQVVKESTPYWRQDWTGGGISAMNGIFLVFNLALIALGISVAWMRSRAIGLFPLAIYFAYIFSNALAFTSGGRYIAPIDWIISLYFLLGLLQVGAWGLRFTGVISNLDFEQADSQKIPPWHSNSYQKIIPTLLIILFIGTLIPLAEMPFEKRYSATSPNEILGILDERGLLEKAAFDQQSLMTFLDDPQAKIYMGRLLYPRYYRAGEGEIGSAHPYTTLDQPRLIFTIIGPFKSGSSGVALFGEKPSSIQHASDVIALGCETDLFLDALAVFVLTEPELVYLRSPQPALQCPFPPPD